MNWEDNSIYFEKIILSWNDSTYLFHMECLLKRQRKQAQQEGNLEARICVTKIKLKVMVDVDEH